MEKLLVTLHTLNYVSMSAIAILVYDTLISFGDEVRLIWWYEAIRGSSVDATDSVWLLISAAWTLPKALYIVSRYYPLLHLIVLFHIRGIPGAPEDVLTLYVVPRGGVICILPPVTALFTLRVCALYSQAKPVVYLAWSLWTIETLGELITTARVEIGQHSDSSIIPGPGCLTVPGKDMKLYQSELLAWVPALIGSSVLFLLTAYKLFHMFKHIFTLDPTKSQYKPRRLELSMLRDGTLHFFLIFVAALLTLISDVSSKLGFFNDLWHPYFLLIYSISGSRLVLNIRRSAEGDEDMQLAYPPTNFWGDSNWSTLVCDGEHRC